MKKLLCSFFILHSSFFIAAAYAASLDVEYKEISADKLKYNVKSGNLKTSGKTEIVGKTGQKITLLDAHLSKTTAGGKNVVMEWDERTMMTAETFGKNEDLTKADNITYTACHNCDETVTAWTVRATGASHDAAAKEMYFYNFWFDMYGVPVFYLPLVVQPDPTVKYRSGLLVPEFSSATNTGTGINVPLYINFSGYHDMTVTGTYLTRENPLVRIEHRLRADRAEFDTAGSYTKMRGTGLDRWHLFHNDAIELGENARIKANIQRTSDKTYLQQYEFYDDQPFLESNVKLELFEERGYATMDANIFQDLRSGWGRTKIPDGDILPKIHGVYQVGISENLYGRFMGDVMRIGDMDNDWSVNRAIGEGRVVAPLEFAWQKFTLSAAARSDHYYYYNYSARDRMWDGYESRLLPSGYVDWEMPFVRAGNDFTQIIRPKARVTALGRSRNENFANLDSRGAILSDASLFSNNRYSGYDEWVNGTYADYGIMWTGYDEAGRGAEIFIGQTYDFDTDSGPDPNSGYNTLGRGASDMVGRVGLDPLNGLSITSRSRFGKERADLRHVETDVRVGGKNYVSVGYIWAVQFLDNDYTRGGDDISEGTVGAGVYLTGRMAVRGWGVYNFKEQTPQRYNAGVYYEHPCYTLGFIYSVDNASKIYDADKELSFRGSQSFKLKFSIKMGK
ncbi:MAG: LPS assembly protein LptD [Rickettsiales bacterium]|jgi:LPS-assembly protein|nr:LPS assembly protein LptD [Rickettsiales bacterium]